MTNGQNSGPGGPGSDTTRSTQQQSNRQTGLGGKAEGAMSKITEAAQQAGEQVRQTAASLATEAGDNAKQMMNWQVGAGAEAAEQVARSVRIAADNLSSSSPMLAGLARLAADRVEQFADTVRDQTVEEMVHTASDFVRRRPALVFGAAAASGFVLFRLLKAAPAHGTPGRQFHYGHGEELPLQPRGNEWNETHRTARAPGQASSGDIGQRFHGV